MKTKILILIRLLSLLIFTSCEPQTKYDAIPEERKPILQSNDTLYFVSQQNNILIDSFKITRENEEHVVYDRDDIKEKITLNYKNINQEPKTNNFTIALVGEFRFGVYNYTPSNDHLIFDTEIDDKKYPVFALKYDSAKKKGQPDSLYYSYKEGILKYFHSDTTYIRIMSFD